MPIKLPFPELLYPYSPVAKPMPPPPVQDVCEGDKVCVSFSCSLIPYLLGLLEVYRYKDSFTGTDEEKTIAVGVMRQLMEVLAMACCGDDSQVVKIHRINPVTGEIEVSSDDGGTWSTDPQSPYTQAIQQRPLSGTDGDIKRCEAANNVVENMKDLQAQYSNMIDTVTNIQDLLIEMIIAAAGMLFLPLAGALLLDALLPLAGKLIDLGRHLLGLDSAGYDAIFTEGNWTIATCILYCNVQSNGKFTQSGWSLSIAQLKSQLGSSFNDAGANMASMIDFWGLVGLNNAASIGAGAEGNCDDCECDCGGETVGLTMVNFFGSDPVATGCNVKATSEPDGEVYSVTWTWDEAHPFVLVNEALVFGDTAGSNWQWYDYLGAGPFTGLTAPIGQALSFLELSGHAGAFRVSWDVISP